MELADEDYLYFVGRAVRGMLGIVTELGDELALTRPDLPGANSPYGLLTHVLGVIEYWAGKLVAGRDVQRDRATEFTATGTVAELSARVDTVLADLAADVVVAEHDAPPRQRPDAWAVGPDRELDQAAILLHVYEEAAQHHGQLEVLRDALVAAHPAPFDPPLDWLRAKRTVKWTRPGPDVLPAWVADMDFPVAPPIRSALVGMLDRGDLGYPDWSPHPLAEAFAHRMQCSFGWAADPALVRPVADLIQAVQLVLELGTEPGDGVLAHLPNYPPFVATLATMRRPLRAVSMIPDGPSWTWDHDALEVHARDARVLLLVNPQNPTGRSFRREELQRLADLAEEHDLLVICDEIHAELVHEPHRHTPFATLAPERTVTVTSATKAYNIAGVRTAVMHVGPAWLRDRLDARPPDLYGTPSTLGVAATVAAWRESDDWLAGLRRHLHAQRDHLVERVEAMPGVAMRVPDAGYLGWLDFRASDIASDPAGILLDRAKVMLAPGPDYDPAAVGWARLNFATSREVLDRVLVAIEDVLTGS